MHNRRDVLIAIPAVPLLLSGLARAGSGPAPAGDGSKDFDCLMGDWKLHNRRLKKIFAGSNEWYEFDSYSKTRPIWGGRANIDEFEADLPQGGHITGLTVRLFELSTKKWRIYWANANRGIFDEPVVGSFKDGVGEFFGPDVFEGKKILVRYRW